MTDDIQVVGRVGITRLHLIGGPLDGIVKWGVVGSALTLKLKKPRQPQQSHKSSSAMSVWFFGNGGGPIEGDEWKVTDAAGVTRTYQHYAVYVPVVQDGKATDRVAFEGILAVEVQSKPKAEPPKPEYEAEEDEGTDDE